MAERIRDRILERASEQFTEWTGLTFADASDVTRMREDIDQWETFAADAEDLAFWVLQGDGGGANGPGREKDLNRETSIRLAKASRRAWSRDPIAGTEAEHYANFSLGRGVNRPVCADQDVQMVVDRAWKDANNQQILLSLDALRGLSHELIASSNVFLVAYRGNGMVRIGILPSDVVKQVVTYPGNPLLPLYYVGQKTEARWDFSSNSWKVDLGSGTKIRYWKQWRNVDELEGDPALDGYAPSDDQLEEGGVYHVRTNRLLEQMFGVPRWNRTLRFMTSLNRLVEARVAMAQASASIIAKRVMRGGKSDVMKAAQTVLQQAGEIGAARVPVPTAAGPAATPRPGMRPGSFHVENEGDQLQAFTLNSGSAQAQQDMQIIRGQAVAPSALGQHLYGDQDAAQLGTAACHDEMTETLTDEGWMTYEQLRERDAAGMLPRVAGFNTKTGRIEYHRPLQKMLQYDYDGELIEFHNERTDIRVTPDHRMWVSGGTVGEKDWRFVEAQDLLAPGPRGGGQRFEHLRAVQPFEAERVETFVLPATRVSGVEGPRRPLTEDELIAIDAARQRPTPRVRRGECGCGCGQPTPRSRKNRYKGEKLVARKGQPVRFAPGHSFRPRRTPSEIAAETGIERTRVEQAVKAPRKTHIAGGRQPRMRPEIKVPMDAFLYWLGWYIAEGWDAEVAQAEHSPYLEAIQKACTDLGVPGKEGWKGGDGRTRMWHWRPRNPNQWKTWLDENCGRGAAEKRVPDFVFDLPADQQMLVLRGLMQGDGSCGKDDAWERCGSSAFGSSSERLLDDVHRLGTNCGFVASRRSYGSVCLVATAEPSPVQGWRNGVARLPAGRRVQYRGRVYCFTLPTNTMVTRRNGRTSFHGNTLELPASMALGAWQEMIEQILRWFTDIVIEEAVRNGELGGNLPDEEDEGSPLKEEDSRFSMIPRRVRGKRLSELVLTEAMDQAEAERRTGKDLSYTFEMPYPGRRNLPDITSTFQTVVATIAEALGGAPVPPTVIQVFLNFLLTHGLQLENASDLSKEMTDELQKAIDDMTAQQQQAQSAQLAAFQQANGGGDVPARPTDPGGQVGTGEGSPDSRNQNRPDNARPVYGEKRAVSGVAQESALDLLPNDVAVQVRKILDGISETYASALADPAAEAAERLNGSAARA